MRHILHVRPHESLSAIQGAIGHSRAKRVALVFPFGLSSDIADTQVLDALAAQCQQTGVDVAVIGGDEALRAAAVAAGFAAATTLDEWDTGTMPAVRAVRSGDAGHTGNAPEDEEPRLAVVRDEEDPDGDTFDDEPPAYVIELMVEDGTYPGPHGEVTAETPDPEDEVTDTGALRAAHEHYEDHITTTIRGTGQLALPPTYEPSPEDGPAQDDKVREDEEDDG